MIALSANWLLLRVRWFARRLPCTECMVMDGQPKANPDYILKSWGFPLSWAENDAIVCSRSISLTCHSRRPLA